jgi:pyridoxine 4-dehydrogenase
MTDHFPAAAAGRFTFPGASISVHRMGFGAMQLAGPHVFGEPKDADEARAVLREAVRLGVDHIDTSDFYGPHVTNRLIRETLYPYPNHLTLVTKIGAWRDDRGGWILDRCADPSRTISSGLDLSDWPSSICAWAVPRTTSPRQCG